jgi:hypothetical protein
VHVVQLLHWPQAQFTKVVVVVVEVVGQAFALHTPLSSRSPVQFLPAGIVLASIATTRLRSREPPPQLTEHSVQLLHSLHSQSTGTGAVEVVRVVLVVVGQASLLHSSLSVLFPMHLSPGGCVLASVATTRLRLRRPVPQVIVQAVHLLHSPQVQFTTVVVVVVVVVGQVVLPHTSSSLRSPLHCLPAGFVLAFVATSRVRARAPPPQDTVHALHWLQ